MFIKKTNMFSNVYKEHKYNVFKEKKQFQPCLE